MEAVINEIMGLVDAHGNACETFGDYQFAANAQECVKTRAAVEARIRQALQCHGCDVPKNGVYQISEPMPIDQRALMLSVTASEPFKSQLKECAARIAELESQLAAAQQGVQQDDALQAALDMLHTARQELDLLREALNVQVEPHQSLFERMIEAAQATHPTTQGLDALTQAARDVLAERQRQINAEGWTPERDDEYHPGVLAEAGGIYALHAYDHFAKKKAPEGWPWDESWWKSGTPRRNLEKAGALILAEIERIDRVAAQAKQGGV